MTAELGDFQLSIDSTVFHIVRFTPFYFHRTDILSEVLDFEDTSFEQNKWRCGWQWRHRGDWGRMPHNMFKQHWTNKDRESGTDKCCFAVLQRIGLWLLRFDRVSRINSTAKSQNEAIARN
jgi:hypothetical protein